MLDRTKRQEEGIQKWIDAKCKASLQWATGVGKSRAGLMAITRFFNKNPDKKVVLFINNNFVGINTFLINKMTNLKINYNLKETI